MKIKLQYPGKTQLTSVTIELYCQPIEPDIEIPLDTPMDHVFWFDGKKLRRGTPIKSRVGVKWTKWPILKWHSSVGFMLTITP